jgi:hypothetical protein
VLENYSALVLKILPVHRRHLLLNFDHLPATAPMHDRIASFTASMHLHEHMLIPRGALQTLIEEQCEAVMSHLREVTRGSFHCARMDLFFKIDVDNRCAFMVLDILVMRTLWISAHDPGSKSTKHSGAYLGLSITFSNALRIEILITLTVF